MAATKAQNVSDLQKNTVQTAAPKKKKKKKNKKIMKNQAKL